MRRIALPLAAITLAIALTNDRAAPRGVADADEEEESEETFRDLGASEPEDFVQPKLLAHRAIAQAAMRQAERHRTTRAGDTPTWTSLGPYDSVGPIHQGVGPLPLGGRINAMRVDPRDPSRVIVATDGGVWAAQLRANGATWTALSDSLPVLATGSFDLDPSAPDTIYAGLGTPFTTPYGGVAKSTDGGHTWSTPVLLAGSSAATLGATLAAGRIQDVRVDPANASNVYVATEVGLFASNDAGLTYGLVDLPNGSGALIERIWSIAYLGSVQGRSSWMISGMTGCAPGHPPPHPANGSAPSANCPSGTLGDVWWFDGASAISLRSANELPFRTTSQGTRIEIGRIDLDVVPSVEPIHANVFAMVNDVDGRSGTVDVWQSTSASGSPSPLSFASMWASAVSNPTPPCTNLNVGSVQGWFNQAIAADYTDPFHIAIGGVDCGVETRDGGISWSVFTAPPSSNYIHADWHAMVHDAPGGHARTIVGNDGGLFWADRSLPPDAFGEPAWQNANQGLVAQQCYTIASGDPATADASFVMSGLQDNGTQLLVPGTHGQFAHVGGGDGTGVALAHDASGASILWESVTTGTRPPPRQFCRPSESDCSSPSSWQESNPTLPANDSEPYSIYFDAIPGDPDGAVLTNSHLRVWRATRALAWTDVTGTQCIVGGTCAGTPGDFTLQLGVAHAFAGSASLFGAALGSGNTAVSSDGGTTWTISANRLGIGPARDQTFFHVSVIAFPPDTASGDVYLAATSDLLMVDGSQVLPSTGHLFVTRDRGATFRPLSGNGTGADLPNVPVYAVRYDRQDASTFYVATEIGLYSTNDGGQTYAPVGQALPAVPVTDIAVASDGSFIRVSTFGRGLWELDGPGADKGDGPGSGSTPSSGCGCRTADPRGGAAGSLLVCAIVLLASRRRRRSRRLI
jgi:hypothetical protein